MPNWLGNALDLFVDNLLIIVFCLIFGFVFGVHFVLSTSEEIYHEQLTSVDKKMKACEQSLPRDEVCALKAIPVPKKAPSE